MAKLVKRWIYWIVTFDLTTFSRLLRLADTATFLRRMTVFYGWLMHWMRWRGNPVMIINGK